MTDLATLQVWLTEARQAYHELQIGKLAVELRHGLKVISYNRANAGALLAYIARLEAEVAGLTTKGAIGVLF